MKRTRAAARKTMDPGSRLSMATLLILMTKRGRGRRKAGGRRGNWGRGGRREDEEALGKIQ